MTRTAVSVLSVACILTMGGCKTGLTERGASVKADLQLASANQTSYVIVRPEKPTAVDDYAVRVLTNFLFQKTGATFPVVAPAQISSTNKHIFVGLSKPALKAIGKDPLALLQDQEYVARSVGGDIFLYGKGIHGNFHAVLDFMETSLGWRWYTKFDPPVFAVERDLVVKPFDRKKGFAFAYRSIPYASVFAYQQGMNMDFTEACDNVRNAAWFKDWSEKEGEKARQYFDENYPSGMVSARVQIGGHVLLCYIPPRPGQIGGSSAPFGWIANSNYFKTNPEFFSMNKSGQRVGDHQLCFSNPELRKELTKNIQEHIRLQDNAQIIVLPAATDRDGTFCECPGCKKLEERYACPGGPMLDYLFELCALLETRQPDVTVCMIAYFQTQKPPKLPAGVMFPRNLVVRYCTVGESLNVEWTHPRNQAKYDEFLVWRKLAPRLWTWLYPNQWAAGGYLPSGIMQRLVDDLRLMKQADCEGVFYEFSSEAVLQGDGFTELQIYVYCKLTQDVKSDVPALIKEFTDYQYGAAAPLVRKYRDELEEAQRALIVRVGFFPRFIDFYGQHAYLTVENIRRWQGYFDGMEKDTAADARCLQNVRRLRRTLEIATLARWSELAAKYPDYFTDYRIQKERLDKGRRGKLHAWEKARVEDLETAIKVKAALKEKPLPPPFDKMEPSRVQRFTPVNSSDPKGVIDNDAAFGFAATVDKPDMPFKFGFYQGDTKKQGPQRALTSAEIKPDAYQLYKLGEIEVTPDCLIWFSGQSWGTALAVGTRLYDLAGGDNKYEVHVSLKFSGPSYGGKSDKDLVLCDQIIFVKTAAR